MQLSNSISHLSQVMASSSVLSCPSSIPWDPFLWGKAFTGKVLRHGWRCSIFASQTPGPSWAPPPPPERSWSVAGSSSSWEIPRCIPDVFGLFCIRRVSVYVGFIVFCKWFARVECTVVRICIAFIVFDFVSISYIYVYFYLKNPNIDRKFVKVCFI